jgi:hypothetical protein
VTFKSLFAIGNNASRSFSDFEQSRKGLARYGGDCFPLTYLSKQSGSWSRIVSQAVLPDDLT